MHNKKYVVVKLISFLLVVECLLQIISFARYVYDLSNYNKEISEKLESNWFYRNPSNAWWRTESRALSSRFEPYLGWRMNSLQTKHIHINEDGLRETIGNSSYERADTQHLFLLGGSTVFGVFASDSGTIASHLAREINTTEANYMVTNYGQIGYNSNQELVLLTQLLKHGQIPELAVFYDGCNDFFSYTLSNGKSAYFYENIIRDLTGNIFTQEEPDYKNNSLINFSLLKSVMQGVASYIKIIHYPIRIGQNLFKEKQTENTINTERYAEEISDNYAKNALMIDNLSKVYNFRYILLWQPLLFNKPLTKDESILLKPNMLKDVYIDTTKLLREKHIKNFFDLTDTFESSTTSSIFIDPCHIGESDNYVIASLIKNIIGRDYAK